MNKRILASIITSAILGMLCVIGVVLRRGFEGNEIFILATWMNRIMIGLVIGLAPYYEIKSTSKNIIFRGAFLGFVISGSFFLATEFTDIVGFGAGIVYGIIIDIVATKYEEKRNIK